jgi:hypothetical protein
MKGVTGMAVTIGIFDKEEKVLEAIRMLREAGADKDEIRVVVGNREGSPLLAASQDVHIEELYEIQEIRGDDGEHQTFPLGVAPVATGYPVGNTTNGAAPTGVLMARFEWEDGPKSEHVLQDIGIPEQLAKECAKAVESGRYLLVADADSEINAQTLLGHAGAADVLHE